MPAYKDAKKNTWYVKFRYKDWTGQNKEVMKRGFATKREALQWERNFMLEKSGSLDMTFADFVQVYLRDRQHRISKWCSFLFAVCIFIFCCQSGVCTAEADRYLPAVPDGGCVSVCCPDGKRYLFRFCGA